MTNKPATVKDALMLSARAAVKRKIADSMAPARIDASPVFLPVESI
jgi:hypothetical protein